MSVSAWLVAFPTRRYGQNPIPNRRELESEGLVFRSLLARAVEPVRAPRGLGS